MCVDAVLWPAWLNLPHPRWPVSLQASACKPHNNKVWWSHKTNIQPPGYQHHPSTRQTYDQRQRFGLKLKALCTSSRLSHHHNNACKSLDSATLLGTTPLSVWAFMAFNLPQPCRTQLSPSKGN